MSASQPHWTRLADGQSYVGSAATTEAFTALTSQIASVVRLVVLLTVALMIHLKQPVDAATSLDFVLALASVYVVATTFLSRRARHDMYTHFLLACDIVLISALVWTSGGTRSEYYLLYYLPILHGASRLNFRDAITTAVLAAIAYFFIAIATGPMVPVVTTGMLRAGTFGGSVIILAIFFAALAQEARTNRLLTMRLREALESVTAVYDVARVASTRDSVQDVLDTMLRQAVRLSEAQAGVLALLDSDQHFQVMVRQDPDDGTPGVEFDEVTARQALERRKWLTRDTASGPPDNRTREFFVPLFSGQQPLAILQVRTGIPSELHNREMGLVGALCAEAAMAIENARLRAETRRAAATDYLTDLYNRREFERRLEAEIRRSARYKNEIALVLLDVDDFKYCNDSYGHQAGDQALQAVASRIQAVIRAEDTAARYGGDEFAIILPQTDAGGGQAVAEKLQRELQGLSFEWAENGWLPTVSIGVASTEDELSASLLLQKADRALYQAKAAGKNQICVWRRGARAETAPAA
jgi:diguanylate cyclase (GGDEF)-like protein